MTDVFRDESDQRADPSNPLGQRQLASKPAALISPIKVSGKKTRDSFSLALAEHAVRLASDDRKAIVVFVNRVATARSVYSLLREKHDAVLLTGRMRSLDKEDVINDKLHGLSTRRSDSRRLERPFFVVATQTLEVGADLDFDGLVTECASLDALRQRFGRLNRKGRPIAAAGAVLIRESETSETDDPVYGRSLFQTWAWLCEHASSGQIGFGILELEKLLPTGQALEVLNAPAPNAPVMLPAHVDAWAQTSPAPTPTPEVSLFLHGRGRTSTDVQVCWRSDIDLSASDSAERWRNLLTYCPPTSAECVPVPIIQLRRWMSGEEDKDDSSDVEGAISSGDTSDDVSVSTRPVIRWLSRNEHNLVSDPSKIKPGDVVVISADASSPSGLADFIQDSDGTMVLDWGERAFCQTQSRPLLRLHPKLVTLWPISTPLREEMLALISEKSVDRLEGDSESLASELQHLLRRIGQEIIPQRRWRWLPEIATRLAADPAIKSLRNVVRHPFGGLVLWSKKRLGNRGGPTNDEDEPVTFSDEDDSAASGTVAVSLSKHLDGVGDFASRFARAAGIAESQAEAIALAARLHDLGKADPRFQRLLGNRLPGSELLAKSGDIPEGYEAFSRIAQESGYPRGGRHELLSVRLAESAAGILPTDDLLRALVLHLVESHHGYCRPFAPVVDDPDPVNVEFELQGRSWRHGGGTQLERLDSGVSTRFWALTRHFGWWGLAWLEAHLRLADHRRSEWEQQHSGDHDAV